MEEVCKKTLKEAVGEGQKEGKARDLGRVNAGGRGTGRGKTDGVTGKS